MEREAGALVAQGEESDVVRVRVPVEGRPSRDPDDAPVTIAMFGRRTVGYRGAA